MRKFIIFLVLIYASFLNGATYIVDSVNAFNYRVKNVNDGDIVRVRAGTYAIGQIEIRDEITIEAFNENNPPTFEYHGIIAWNTIFSVYSRKLTFKNIKIDTNAIAVNFETNNGEYEFINTDINKPSIFTETVIQMKNTQKSILIENCNFYSKRAVAFMELQANNINITNSKIDSSVGAIYIWSANSVNLTNTDITVRNGAVGVDGSTITGAIKIQDTQNVSINGGKITGSSTGDGTRAIEIGKDVQNIKLNHVCLYAGAYSLGVNRSGNHNIKITNSAIQSYNNQGFWYRTNSDISMTNSCLNGSNPLPSQSYNSSSNSFNGNYWEDTGFRNRYDNAPLVSCPPENDCVYEEKEEPKNYKFDAWDTFRNIHDRNISTKIVNKNFNLVIASLNEDGDDFQDFNGTLCVRIEDNKNQNLTSWKKEHFTDKNTTTINFTIKKASKDARAMIVWKKDVNEPCPLSDETNSTKSSDNFAIRPSGFNIDAPATVKSGEDFNITFEGLQNGSGTANGYNESVNTSFLVNYKEQKSDCISGNFDNNISSGWEFANGFKSIENSYDEVGVLDINITDKTLTCNELFARVDCDDKNVSGHWNTDDDVEIGEDKLTINFTLDHFEIDADLSNFQNGDFTYLANDVINMYAPLDIDILAKNADGNNTKNYNPKCYAKTTNLDISYLNTAIEPDIINTIITHETNTSLDLNQTFSDKSINMALPKDIFSDGNASLHVRLNFDRNISNPINPFDMNITDMNITDSDNVVDTVQSIDGNASFFYGRVRPVDLTTTSNEARTYGEFEIYDTNTRTDMLQNSLYWYRNILHVNNNYGKLSNPRDSQFGENVPSATSKLDVSLSSSVGMGLQNINIKPKNSKVSITRTVHFETNSWEWFTSSDNPQTYNANNSCLTHPCLDYEYRLGSEDFVQSGSDFGGSDVNLTKFKSNQTQKRGVKVFR